ncbi:MAG: hypothetical protein KA761_00260 [Gemmatimonadaceae bacterium]|nr:hypothetical protein [Gemmatimonadaceae bacterium]
MSRDEFLFWIRGALKSWTVWLGMVVAAAPEWWPIIRPQVEEVVGSDRANKAIALVVGILIIAVRLKTTQSLPDKGGRDGPPLG